MPVPRNIEMAPFMVIIGMLEKASMGKSFAELPDAMMKTGPC
ncbi:hypothetical protein C4K18_5456 [Pseudomonas chlororaphis subsp. aurantiaca]|nr:hypothetical protein C4K18_5456 [Pseudomonas chlororaphis subsp. aurantiaca]